MNYHELLLKKILAGGPFLVKMQDRYACFYYYLKEKEL
jgi:hypothetical protein